MASQGENGEEWLIGGASSMAVTAAGGQRERRLTALVRGARLVWVRCVWGGRGLVWRWGGWQAGPGL